MNTARAVKSNSWTNDSYEQILLKVLRNNLELASEYISAESEQREKEKKMSNSNEK